MTTPTTNYGWLKPVNGGDSDTWGTELNTLIDAIDSQVKTNANAASAAQTTANSANTAASAAQTSANTALSTACLKASNLSDLANATTARGNLGITTNLIAVTYFISTGTPTTEGSSGDLWFKY